jgi:glycosyltransferase involved in cell wall biosynthesis/O-antigen/teichoic acid export membrane protein
VIWPGRTSALRAGRLGRVSWDAAPLLLALAVLNASNYAFHVAATRALGPGDYGQLASLLAALMVLSVPFAVVQTLVAKRAAALRPGDDPAQLAAGVLKALLPLGLVGGAALAAASPLLASFLKATTPEVALLGPYAALSAILAAQSGILQGRLRFGALAWLTAVGVAARLGVGLGLVYAGFGVTGALLGTIAAHMVAVALGSLLVRTPRSTWVSAWPSLQPFRGETLTALLSLGSFWVLAELDILLARHYLPDAVSGFYSSAGLVARSLLFLPSALALVALPRFAAARDRPDEAWAWLVTALRLLVALVAVGLAGLVSLRWVVIGVAYGERYRPAASLLPLLAAGSAVLAVINLLVFFHIAFRSRAYLFILAGVGLEAGSIAAFHGSGYQIGAGFLGASVLVAALQLHAARALAFRAPSRRRLAYETVAAADSSGGERPRLSVVLPCHNAGPSLAPVIEGLRRQLAGGPAYELIVVSDGSTDETVRIASAALGGQMRVIHYPERVGKGQALRVGLGEARGAYVAFIDADGDIDPASIAALVETMEVDEPDIVLASKRHPLSEVDYPTTRRVLSWWYHKLGRFLFRVDVRDTQTGLKLIRREVLETVLPKLLEKRFAFDLELLVVARRHGFDRVVEVPVRIDYRFSSTIRPRTVVRILLDTLAIFYRRYILDSYRPEGPVAGRRPVPALGERLRILVVNWRDLRHPESGGAEVWTHQVASRWAAQGHEVSLLTSGFAGGRPAETIDGVRVRRRGRLRNGSFHLLVQRELSRLRDVDVIVDEINSVPFMTPLWRGRAPVTAALIHQLAADVWDAELPRPLAAVARAGERLLLRLYRDVSVVAVSESTRADLVELGFRDVRVVHGGCEPPPAAALGLPKEERPTFLFAGRLVRNKRPDHALEAFREIVRELPDARLWLTGRGPLEASLRRELPPGAELLGFLPRLELYERMARAHALLVPSVREGWGLVVIEANSVGTPAVGYDVAGLRDSIRDGVTGLLAPAGRPEELARAAVRLVSEHELYERVRRSALEWSATFSWSETADCFLAFLAERRRLEGVEPGPAAAVAAGLVAVGAPEH